MAHTGHAATISASQPGDKGVNSHTFTRNHTMGPGWKGWQCAGDPKHRFSVSRLRVILMIKLEYEADKLTSESGGSH
jgi:hypothetical protein